MAPNKWPLFELSPTFYFFFLRARNQFQFLTSIYKKINQWKKIVKSWVFEIKIFFFNSSNDREVQNPGTSFWLCHKEWSWQQSSHGDTSIEFFYFFWLSSPIGNAQFGHQGRWTWRYLLHHNYIHQNCKQCLWQVKPPFCF